MIAIVEKEIPEFKYTTPVFIIPWLQGEPNPLRESVSMIDVK